ncbi:hypothetical protein STXM2123_3093 [Streptomyces sp. F-3]|nr:hypothetical protein STXM2123_3093 [Streptomyces sp. F-3]
MIVRGLKRKRRMGAVNHLGDAVFFSRRLGRRERGGHAPCGRCRRSRLSAMDREREGEGTERRAGKERGEGCGRKRENAGAEARAMARNR